MGIIVVGANGYLGKRIAAAGSRLGVVRGTSSSPAPGLMRLELSRPMDFDYAQIAPGDVVYLTAAISAPDICANEHERAYAVNVRGSSKFIERSMAQGARVVFFSSDTVYGDTDSEVDEAASCNPAGAYARMKCEVEKRFCAEPSFKALRLSYVFSRTDKFTRYLLGCADSGVVAEVFRPFLRAIVHLDDVVAAALSLARKWDSVPGPVVNVGGPALVAREEFAEVIRRSAAPALRYSVKEPPRDFFVNRPAAICMRSPLLAGLLERPARSLHEAAVLEFAGLGSNAAGAN